jgi:DNA-binding beta-propeller fold protein YncE
MRIKNFGFIFKLSFISQIIIILILFIPCNSFSMDNLRVLPTELDSVVWMGKNLLGLNVTEKKVFVVDAKTQRSIKTFTLNLSQPKALVFDGTFLWVADEADRKIVKLNPTDGRLIKAIKLKKYRP